jgi:hypothetical protein
LWKCKQITHQCLSLKGKSICFETCPPTHNYCKVCYECLLYLQPLGRHDTEMHEWGPRCTISWHDDTVETDFHDRS